MSCFAHERDGNDVANLRRLLQAVCVNSRSQNILAFMVSNRVFIASLFLIRLHKILVSMSMEECSLEMWLYGRRSRRANPRSSGARSRSFTRCHVCARSRDNLPNPVQNGSKSYVPSNMPAIGDLFDLFSFKTTPKP